MTVFEWVFVGAGGLAALYVAAWTVARAFFDNKEQYTKRMLRELEEERE